MSARQVGGIDRAMTRYRVVAAEMTILRNLPKATLDDDGDEKFIREMKDKRQAHGIPVLIIPTPAWPREDWAQPQRRRTRKAPG